MKIKLQQVEAGFGPRDTELCDLLLQTGTERISYAVIQENRLKAIFEGLGGSDNLSDLISRDPLLQSRFRQVKISVDTDKFTFVPQEIFSEGNVKDYLRFVQPLSPADILITELQEFEIRNVVAISSDLQNQLRSYFPQATLRSQIDPFLKGIHYLIGNQNAPMWFLNFRHGSFEAALVKNGELQFYNVLQSKDPDEFNYFLLLLLRQFQASTNSQVIISGSINIDDLYHSRLSKYFREVKLAELSGQIQWDSAFDQLPLHQYFSLLSLSRCE
ncbi:MAG TPA: DUF3822 family protein [Sphingobacteriaceae bacterium]